MTSKVFSVFDIKAGAYLAPFVAPSEGVATRIFKGACMDENSLFWHHPRDFRLFDVGFWNEVSGELMPKDPVMICGAEEFVDPVKIGRPEKGSNHDAHFDFMEKVLPKAEEEGEQGS